MTTPQHYDHKTRESHWQTQWEEKRIYAWRGDKPRAETYVIDTPPPTVSGHLHMGHIFSYTHADFIARYQRMKGKDVFYPMGFDDNGLPTERLVEKTKKVRATDMSREAFISLCEEVSAEARKEFRALFTSTALSVDWRQEYHTISKHARRVSQASFIDLYNKGQVYRKLQPMLWDPVDQTAIAQAEVEDKEMSGVFCDIYFEVTNADGTPLNEAEFGDRKLKADSDQNAIIWREGRSYIVIGTTRPEMIPACVGIFFHGEDQRYQGLEDKVAYTPLFGVRVDIHTDDTVEPDKGTGIMMCCTFGDEADIVKWRKYNLPMRVILNKYGKIEFYVFHHGGMLNEERLTHIQFLSIYNNQEVSTHDISILSSKNTKNIDVALKNFDLLKTLKATAAREKMIELLKDSGDLVDTKPITHAVKCAERSGAPLEILPTQQWFVNVLDHKEALKAKSAQCDWKPEWMAKRMEQWIDGLNWDWCISRQRYYGVPFPMWYSKRAGEEGTMLLPDIADLPVNPMVDLPKGYSREEVEADLDVMDTWATSSLTPQISAWNTAGAVIPAKAGIQPLTEVLDSRLRGNDAVADAVFPTPTARSQALFPADLRPQAHEIIRTWAFYTLAKAHLHHDIIPWKNLMISGWCLASDKTKMSKSKGNVVTPAGLLETHSSDAVRYWASTSRLGSDTAFSEDVLKIGRKLVNKLWNASKFVLGMMESGIENRELPDSNLSRFPILDRWMLSRIHHAITEADTCFAEYDYAGARAAVEDVFWNDFCDNYLELVKARAYGNMGEEGQASAISTLSASLNALLKLFAPFVPHITEELYHLVYAKEAARQGSIHARGNFPKADAYPHDAAAEVSGELAVAVLELIRKAKSERGVSIKYPIDVAYLSGVDGAALEGVMEDIKAAGTVAELHLSVAPAPADAVLQDEARGYTLAVTFAAEASVA